MDNLLLSAAIGDIAGSAYEFNATKKEEDVVFFHPKAKYTDDTVCTFACATWNFHFQDFFLRQ